MKKVILTAIAVMAFGFANAQEGKFKVGAHAGLPLAGTNNFYSVNLGADVAYMWKVADKFSVGATTGFSTYLAKDYRFIDMGLSVTYKPDNISFIPIAATGQYYLSDKFFVGADLGYAVSLDKGNGGVLYQPKFGFQNEKIELYVAYKGVSYSTVSDQGFGIPRVDAIRSLNLGFNYKF